MNHDGIKRVWGEYGLERVVECEETITGRDCLTGLMVQPDMCLRSFHQSKVVYNLVPRTALIIGNLKPNPYGITKGTPKT